MCLWPVFFLLIGVVNTLVNMALLTLFLINPKNEGLSEWLIDLERITQRRGHPMLWVKSSEVPVSLQPEIPTRHVLLVMGTILLTNTANYVADGILYNAYLLVQASEEIQEYELKMLGSAPKPTGLFLLETH